MLRATMFFALLMLGAASVASAQAPLPAPTQPVEAAPLGPTDADLVEAFVDGQVAYAMKNDHVAGVSVAVVHGGRVLLAKGYGRARGEPPAPADADTLFRVGSISKVPVYLAAMQLVEQGKLSLDDPIDAHLPEPLRIPDGGFAEPIRVRHLLTHTSGFEDSFAGHLFRDDPAGIWTLDEWLVRFRPERVAAPGVRAVYSNYSLGLLGRIVAQVSGLPWEQYAEERIFRPLGMAAATYREPYPAEIAAARGLPAPPPPDVAARFADGFLWEAGRFEPAKFEYVTQTAPAGSMSASARDMAAFMIALLDPARLEAAGVMRGETALAMREPLFRNADGVAPVRHGFLDYTLADGRMAFGHAGDLLRFHADMFLLPDAGLGVFVSTSSAGGVKLRGRLARDLVARFFPAEGEREARPADAAEQAQRVAGTYMMWRRPQARSEILLGLLNSGVAVLALADGDILVAGGGSPEPLRYAPVGDLKFRAAETGGVIRFAEQDGAMRLYGSMGVNGGDRVGFFGTPNGVLLPLIGAGLAAMVWLWSSLKHAVRRAPAATVERWAGRTTTLAAVLWLAGLAALGAAVARFLPRDAEAVLFAYPGFDYMAMAWFFLAAALATAAAAGLTIYAVSIDVQWRWPRRILQMLVLAIFAGAGLAAWSAGVLGYSGFSGA